MSMPLNMQFSSTTRGEKEEEEEVTFVYCFSLESHVIVQLNASKWPKYLAGNITFLH